MAERWRDEGRPEAGRLRPAAGCRSRTKPHLAEALGEAGVAVLIERFQARAATKQELAIETGYSVSSVERLLRERGVRRWKVVK